MAAFAASQHGVVSRRQLLEAGLSSRAIDGRLLRGGLHSLYRGVYAVGHPHLTVRGRWLAAVFALGEGAVLSHRTAAALWGLRPSTTANIEVAVPTRGGRAPRAGIVLHRVQLPADEVTRHEHIPVTTPARTLLDLAAVLSGQELRRAVERAEQLRLFDLGLVTDVLRRHPKRRGSRALASVLEQWEEPPLSRSELERLFLGLCARHGLPTPVVNATIAGYEVDFLWRAKRLIVEADGRETHLTRAAFEDDRARDAKLTVLGYRVVRFTYRQALYEPEAVARVLRALLVRS